MKQDFGTLDAALAAALGDDAGLVAELRAAFLDGAAAHLATLAVTIDPSVWTAECWRLHGLAASFGAIALMAAASDAAAHGPGSEMLDRLRTQHARLTD